MTLIRLFILTLIFTYSLVCSKDFDQPLKICLDNSDWRPFIYQENDSLKGLHIDTIVKSLEELKINFKFIPTPWKRCLKGAEKGVFDAIATASFNEDRSIFLWYPEDSKLQSSEWRVGQVQYNIIVHQNDKYEYQTELKHIPKPIRVPREYSIGYDLMKMGFEIDNSSISDLQNLKRLVREESGSVIALPSLAHWANQQQEYKDKIRLIETPIKSKSYFLAFSKSGQVNYNHSKLIWDKIKSVRENNQFKDYQSNSKEE